MLPVTIIHHTMMIRNRTMEKWFALKDGQTQAQPLKLSGKKAPETRNRHQEEEQAVLAQRTNILDQRHQQLASYNNNNNNNDFISFALFHVKHAQLR